MKTCDPTENVQNLADGVYRKREGVIVTKDFESDVDLCPHAWKEIDKRREFTIYKCEHQGCLRFDTPYRTALDNFIRFLRSYLWKLPKLKEVQESGYIGPEKLRRKTGLNYEQVRRYAEVVSGFEILGRESLGIIRISTNGEKLALYRDPPKGPDLSGILPLGEGSFGTFLLCDSWKKRDWDWTKTLEVTAGISLLVDGSTRALTGKGVFEHLLGLISENWG